MNKVYGYDTNIYEISIGNIKYLNEEKYIEMLEDGILYDYIKDLQKKAELGEHYKHLYSEVKKQKDDAIKFLKSIEMDKTDKYIPLRDYKEFGILLRMLGEIDVED